MNFYYIRDRSTAPGYGMRLIENKNQDNLKQYFGIIYSFEKKDHLHSEKSFLMDLILEMLDEKEKEIQQNNMQIFSKIEENSNLEEPLLKKLHGIIYIYVNNQPCFLCLEAYSNLIQSTNLKFHVLYTKEFKNDKASLDTKELQNSKIYQECTKKCTKTSRENNNKMKTKNEKSLTNSDSDFSLDCINKWITTFFTEDAQIKLEKINLNEKYVKRISALKKILNIS